MRLERLEISGFKSFSERSELAFDEGVTAIVGPNGCGKSNVADAITWVLGEQSAKSLRGDRMEDVIFNGSDARKPTGSAEVRLLLTGVTGTASVRADGNGECWGYDGDGQTTVPPLWPERGYLSVEASERHSCSLDSDLHVKCWGMSPPPHDPYNFDPDYHPDFATFRALSVGAYHSCAIRTNGRLLCWGEDWTGQLRVPEGTFVAVSAGHTHTCAIRTDGSRECWGDPWMSPKLVLDPESLHGVRPGEWLSVQFQLRSDSPYPVQDITYAVVAGTLPLGFRLEPTGELHGSWHETGRFKEADGSNSVCCFSIFSCYYQRGPVRGFSFLLESPSAS